MCFDVLLMVYSNELRFKKSHGSKTSSHSFMSIGRSKKPIKPLEPLEDSNKHLGALSERFSLSSQQDLGESLTVQRNFFFQSVSVICDLIF